MNIKIAQIDALEKQIAEMKKQFQQSQLHSAELLKAKDQAWAIKLKQAEEAAKREADSQSQCALIDELQDEVGIIYNYVRRSLFTSLLYFLASGTRQGNPFLERRTLQPPISQK